MTEKKETPKKKKKDEATVEATADAVATEEKPKATKKKAKKKETFVARGKRKESIARAWIIKGNGKVRVNNLSADAYYVNKYVREIAKEALRYVGPEINNLDVHVNVHGGGIMGQAQATRTAIANALVEQMPELKEKFLQIDRSLLVEDVRRVEPKKYKGPKARARYQKSYR